MVTPARIQRSLVSTRMSHSARASCERSLIPVRRPSSSTSSAATRRPSSRANATRSRQVELAGRGRRTQVADPAAEPGRVDGVQPGVDLADLELLLGGVLLLDDPLHGPAVVADDAAQAGRVDGGDRDAARSRRGPSTAPRAATTGAPPRPAGTSPETTRTSSTSVVQVVQGRPERVAGAARDVLEGGVGAFGDGVPDLLGRRRVDDQRAGAGGGDRGVQHVLDHRPAAQRVQDLGQAWTSCGCRDRPRGRSRPSAARAFLDWRGSRVGAPLGSRPGRRRWSGGGARADGSRCHQRPGDSGVARRRVSTRGSGKAIRRMSTLTPMTANASSLAMTVTWTAVRRGAGCRRRRDGRCRPAHHIRGPRRQPRDLDRRMAPSSPRI